MISLKVSDQTQARWDCSDLESALSFPNSWLFWMCRYPSDNWNDSGVCLLIIFQLSPTDCIIAWYFNNTMFCFCHANLQLVQFPHCLYGKFLQKHLHNYLAIPMPNSSSLTKCLHRMSGGEDCDINSHLMSVCVTHMWNLRTVGRDVHINMSFLLSRRISSIEKSKPSSKPLLGPCGGPWPPWPQQATRAIAL